MTRSIYPFLLTLQASMIAWGDPDTGVRPRLVLGIVVDQMRFEQLNRYHESLSKTGLAYLPVSGFSFTSVHNSSSVMDQQTVVQVIRQKENHLAELFRSIVSYQKSLRPGIVYATLLSDPRGGTREWPRWGCFLHVRDTGKTDINLTEYLRRWFEVRTWSEVLTYGADGPDGTMFAHVRDSMLCIVEGRWHSGNDTDPRSIPQPGSEVVVICVRAAKAELQRE